VPDWAGGGARPYVDRGSYRLTSWVRRSKAAELTHHSALHRFDIPVSPFYRGPPIWL
jgi:hypothetical protein